VTFADRVLVCRDCGRSFTFTAGEQQFYARRGLRNTPSRCPSCRSARKASKSIWEREGYIHYGTFASFGGRNPRQMHPVICADCGEMTEVPFLPRSNRPVYCHTCYEKARQGLSPG